MPEELPSHIGDYEVIRRIGGGAMGEVFLVKKSGEGGFVTYQALKQLHGATANDPEFIRALFREARIGGLLAHPNLVQTHEAIRVDDTYAVVMEYVDGADVAEILHECRLGEATLPPRAALELAAQVADGLHFAHELRDPEGGLLRLVHRDLKPANIRISRAGAVKVLDFGIARLAGGTSSTVAGSLKGTIRYMSPEQARGELTVGPSADIYGLGAVLFELLTLERLHPHDGIHECLASILYGNVDERLALLPEETRPLVSRALASAPGDRQPTARHLADEARKLASTYADHTSIQRQLEELVGKVDHARETRGNDCSGPASVKISAGNPRRRRPTISVGGGPGGRAAVSESRTPATPDLSPLAKHVDTTGGDETVTVDASSPSLHTLPRGAPIADPDPTGGSQPRVRLATTSLESSSPSVSRSPGAVPDAYASDPPPRRGWMLLFVVFIGLFGMGSLVLVVVALAVGNPPLAGGPAEPIVVDRSIPAEPIEHEPATAPGGEAADFEQASHESTSSLAVSEVAEPVTAKPEPTTAAPPVEVVQDTEEEATPPLPVARIQASDPARRTTVGKQLWFTCSTPGRSDCSVRVQWSVPAQGTQGVVNLVSAGEGHTGSLTLTGEHAPELTFFYETTGCGQARWPASGTTGIKVY